MANRIPQSDRTSVIMNTLRAEGYTDQEMIEAKQHCDGLMLAINIIHHPGKHYRMLRAVAAILAALCVEE